MSGPDQRPDDLPTIEDCTYAMRNVHAFLHGELSENEADEIRGHLMTCEQCLQFYDVETLITALVRRSCPPEAASSTLRLKVSDLHVTFA